MTMYARSQTAKPDLARIDRVAEENYDLLNLSRARWTTNESYFNGTYDVWGDAKGKTFPNRPSYHTPKARAMVMSPVKTQFSYEAKPAREPVGDSEHAEEYASLVERWVAAMLRQLAMRTPVWKALNLQQLLYGKGVLEALRWVSQPDEDEPERDDGEDQDEFEGRLATWEWERKNWFPFRAGVIHPANFLADPWEKQPAEVVVRKSLRVSEIEQLVQKKIALKRALADTWQAPAKGEQRRVVDEYFNKSWHAMRIKGGEMLFLERNTRAYVPYMQLYTGDGIESSERETPDAVDMAVGIYEGNKDALKVWDQQASIRHMMLVRKGTASVYSEKTGADAMTALSNAAHGDALLGFSKDQLGVIPYPDVTNDLFTEVGVMEKMLTENSFPPNLMGQKQRGVDTVGQEMLLSRAAQRIFDGIAQNQAEAATWTAENALKALVRYGNPITALGVTLEPKHVQNVFAIRVEFPNPDLSLQAVEWQQAEKDNVRGIIPDEMYRKIRGIEDEGKVRQGLLRDSIRKHPSVQAAMAEAEAELIGAPYNPEQNGAEGQTATNGRHPVSTGVNGAASQ
mgnify:CR=1 FL=1